ncbi:MAG TPA: SprT family zinc-dependent metalloprotease [Stellaceae bacterium]|nr:SprT family zinc-dependent metalloprotease [Stellaceae bacterium]
MADAASVFSSFPTSWSYTGGEVAVRLRPHPRARRLALRIDATGEAIELVLPRRGSRGEALRFLEANRAWLDKRLSALPPRTAFEEGAVIPVLDQPHVIRHIGRARGRGPVWLEAGAIWVSGDPAFLARRVRDFLRALAKQELSRRSHALAESIGHKVIRVGVRDTTTRWGSCARTGSLSFSWRLIFAPEAVVDYVVAHEVAHLAEMNHGPRFWRLVERLHPAPKAQRLWLNRNRARLMRIG